MGKVFIFGIDGAMPEKIFGEWLKELPNIRKLMEQGCYARLNSTIPPLSGTAWISIFSGRTPADTSIFEYVYRKNFSYNNFSVISSYNVKQKLIWEFLSEQNKKTISLFVPLTWPIKPFNGHLISGFMTPKGKDVNWGYPGELKQEISSMINGEFLIDVPNFRNLSKWEIIQEVYRVSEMHISSMEYLLKNKEWDLFIGILNGSDRINHSFWRYCDFGHRKYEKESVFRDVLKDYYKFVDKKIGELIKFLNEDDEVIILSDHGITRMHSRINLTDWLIKEGYMVLREVIKEKTEFGWEMVDWKKTRVFAIGAYDGEIFVNLRGREPEGIVEINEYDSLLKELEEKLKKITGDDGKELDTKIFKKKEFFCGEYEKLAPDLIVFFDNLQYGCNTTLVGNKNLWSLSTAKGSDDAGHSRQGIFIMKNSEQKGDIGEISYLEIVPTILNKLCIKIPEGIRGKIIK